MVASAYSSYWDFREALDLCMCPDCVGFSDWQLEFLDELVTNELFEIFDHVELDSGCPHCGETKLANLIMAPGEFAIKCTTCNGLYTL